MALIEERDKVEVQRQLAGMTNPVKIINVSQKLDMYYSETRQLMEELTALSDKLDVETYDFAKDRDIVEKYGIDKTPATIIMGERDYGIRFYGIPSGYEFVGLLQAILMASKGDSGLSVETRKKLAEVKEPLHLQVFVTPTCPHCPQVVHLAHQLAVENEHIVADMVEATEFPQLSQRYGVMGVPKTVANGHGVAHGALPEALFVENILAGLEVGLVP